MEKYVCIHGHFYQPPRENPWLEEVELQDSAYPYHDWNDRITAECYGPNAVARMLDHEWKIVNIVNNYTSISLNFGPTLLSWLKDKKPDVYQSILEADKQSQEKFSGHGTALAQAYNHVIMPLANARDKFTQAVWGIKDFEFRFGRKPEGMWLPETAVDLDTLEILAELGIRFTILSPYQAKQVRKLDSEQWQDATGARIDPTTPYIQNLPSGRSIILFFYDGHTSRAVAFEKLLESGERFANRLLEGFSSDRPWPQIVHIATDGESYGHHHVHGDMGLAFALHHIEKIPDVRVTIYGEFLDKHPPTHEVQIQEYTAWSCSHGVERWKSNCGCNSGRGQWNQEWRTPLREALDWLRDEVANPFEETTKEYLRDPWAARNEYVRVILDRSEENVNAFLDEFAARELTHEDKVTVLQLMELQRNAMLMYTSCGWFFDDISGIETVQVIAYAGRVIQLAQHLFDCDFEPAFLDRLEKAKSNLPEHQDGRHIYNKWIKPSIVDWEKIAAHYGVSSLFETYEETTKIYCYTAERTDYHSFVAGKAKMVVGRTKVSSEITWATKELSFGVLHFGDHNVNGGVRQFEDEKEYQTLLQELIEAFEKADFPQIIRLLDKGFKKSTYSLKSLFRDEQRKILKLLLQSRISEAESVYRRMYEDNLPTMRFLSDIESPLPKAFKTALEFVVSNDLNWAFKDDEPDLDHIKHLLEEAERWNVTLDIPGLAYRLKNSLGRMAERFQAYPTEMGPMLALEQSVDLASSLPFEVDLWQPQNIYCRLLENIYPELVAKAQAEDEAARSWIEHFVSLGEKLGIQVADLKKKIANLKKAPTFANVLEEILTKTHIPRATYRLQLNSQFTFQDAEAIVPYLHQLGISDCYASPILQARPNSSHGYDICDHSHINRELGDRKSFDSFTAALQIRNMGMILDTVPNHMGIGHENNHWWMDVLENGPSSVFADYFDIDWNPINPNLKNKVLLPVLGDQYGTVLENSQIKLNYEDGAFYFSYYEHRFPVSPGTYSTILEINLPELQEKLGEDNGHFQELQSILTAIGYLPSLTETDPEHKAERNREKEIIKRRIATLAQQSPEIEDYLETILRSFEGWSGDSDSFDLLDSLLEKQSFRPAFWRVATEEINYRRFFDINDLAAIRVEKPEVFQATHQIFFNLLAENKATGLRIDHPDGLWNPTDYFRNLQETFSRRRIEKLLDEGRLPEDLSEEVAKRFITHMNDSLNPSWPLYVVAEKILAESEPLPHDWAVHGTSGYDALNSINGIFVNQENEEQFTNLYQRFLGRASDFDAIVQSSKRMIMLVSLASEINSLSHLLDQISERNRRYRDFTLNSLTFAIREIIASLPVYRTYISNPETVALRDRMYIEAAVEEAKQRNPRTADSIFHFIRDTLLMRNFYDFHPVDQPLVLEWVMKFQQITGPVMAKGVEDTAFYIYNRLVSLNEVGGHPNHFGTSVQDFHHQNCERRERWPHSMVASSTHDTKRSEDVRARLNVLSEIPEEWDHAIIRWHQMNSDKKRKVEKIIAPSKNDEYLLYQTLVGAWPNQPLTPETLPDFRTRIANYMQKATKEAKVHTSWVNANAEYDGAVWDFVHKILPDNLDSPFINDLRGFQEKIAFFGYLNSLSQTLVKLTCPGMPDIYQGTELWDLSLVDPDNRRPVDYEFRKSVLNDMQQKIGREEADLLGLANELLHTIKDGRVKLYVIHQTLMLRRNHDQLLTDGDYLPARSFGEKANHLCSYLRHLGKKALLVAVPRLVNGLLQNQPQFPFQNDIWKETWISLPHGKNGQHWRNVFTGQRVQIREKEGQPVVYGGELFRDFPVFLGTLERTSGQG